MPNKITATSKTIYIKNARLPSFISISLVIKTKND